MSPRGSRGKRVSSDSSAELLARPPFTNAPNRVLPLARLEFNMRDVYPAHSLGARGNSASLRHARRRCLSPRPKRCAPVQGRRLCSRSDTSRASSSHRWPEIRFPTRRPQFFLGAQCCALARPGGADRSQRAVRAPAQRRRGEDRRGAGCAVRVDALVYEPLRHDPLRTVQQMPRAAETRFTPPASTTRPPTPTSVPDNALTPQRSHERRDA